MTHRRGLLHPALHRVQRTLDDLPPGAVILDSRGHAWQADRIYWYRAFGDDSCVSSWDLSQITGPKITVIHPQEAS